MRQGIYQDVLVITGTQFMAGGTRLYALARGETAMQQGLLAALLLVLASASCTSREDGGTKPARSERERDSVLGASRLPGARGIRGALGASDSADARNARLDSVAKRP